MTGPLSAYQLPVQADRSFSPEVERAIEYIIGDYCRITRIEDISRASGCPYNTLRQVFRRETGLTLAAFLTLVRVREASRLMVESDDLLKEIAWEVGFRYEHRLARAFLRVTGRTPQYHRAIDRIARITDDCLGLGNVLARSEMQVKNVD